MRILAAGLRLVTMLCLAAVTCCTAESRAEEWPAWRGPRQDGISKETNLPLAWSQDSGVAWQCELDGEGSSSPIVWHDHVFVTSASRGGDRRWVHAINRRTGKLLWTRELQDDNPEYTSPLTGYAAATPVTDGQCVYAWFGNAGLVCFDFNGQQVWHRQLGDFQSELGLASSPVISGDRLFLQCDHDGDRFRSFDSFLIALDKHTGEPLWRAERPGLFRSWSTPLVCAEQNELIVSGEKELRGYDLATGEVRWHVDGLLEWVAPSPIAQDDLVIAMCGRNGPILAARKGQIPPGHQRLVWHHDKGGSYVSSPLIYDGRLYVHDEQGILACYDLEDGAELFRERMRGTFYGSAVAAENRLYFTNVEGTTYAVRAGPKFEILARNSLHGEFLGSPAISNGSIYLRSSSRLYCVGPPK